MNLKRFLPLNLWFALFVVVPTALSSVYYGLIASDQYVSESRFVVRGRADRPNQIGGLAGLVQATGLSNGQEQTNEVLDYIRSRNALAELQRTLDIRSKYTDASVDLLSKYPPFLRSDRFENLLRYYSSMIDTRIDTETGLAVLDVRAFKPQDAQKINATLLDFSERLVNRLNAKSRDKAITEAEQRVRLAEDRVRRARSAMGEYRNLQDLVDPVKQAGGVLAISDKLVSQQASLQAQLDLISRVAPRNPSIPALRQQIASYGRAIANQNGRAVGSKSALSSKMGNFEKLSLEQEFAAQTLTAANASLEQASAEAVRQQYYLERVVEPNAPDLSRYPQRFWRIMTVLGASLCLYLIGWMLVVGILEHSPDD